MIRKRDETKQKKQRKITKQRLVGNQQPNRSRLQNGPPFPGQGTINQSGKKSITPPGIQEPYPHKSQGCTCEKNGILAIGKGFEA